MGKPDLSVIIPVLNEAEALPALLHDIKGQKEVTVEIIIGDGGSTDGSQRIVADAGVLVVQVQTGRGAQMNGAAAKASGEFLLFLHADCTMDDPYLFSKALKALRTEISFQKNFKVAGHFPLRFVRTTKRNNYAYRYLEEKTRLNRVNTTNGDQGFMLARAYFKDLGGFEESLPFLEDQELAERIRKGGVWITLPGTLQTSARRFETEGFHRRYILMSMMMGCYSVGMKTFFAKAPSVYKDQQEARFLRLYPVLAVVWEIMVRDLGFWRSVQFWYRLGRYIRSNAWQLFFLLDVALRNVFGRQRYVFLKLYDKLVGPVLNFTVFDVVTGVLSFIWFMLILTPYFWVQEKLMASRKVRSTAS
jgi:rSAM/selenodomain-associated transferase 2